MSSAYLTTFKGELTLKPLKPQAVTKLIQLIKQKGLFDTVSLSQDMQSLYISGAIDNTLEPMEKFLVKIFPLVDISDNEIIQAQGESATDRYDLVYGEDGLYVQYYIFKKETLTKYKG